MNRLITKTFTAQAVIGFYKGYSTELITFQEFKNALFIGQQKTKKQFNVMLSTKITLCEIVFLGQEEPSITIDFIQYPKFPVEEKLMKNAIIYLIEFLMDTLFQNRTVIVFSDETICLENTEAIDPKIDLFGDCDSEIITESKTNETAVKSKNMFLYCSDDFGKMERGVVYNSRTYESEINESEINESEINENDLNFKFRIKKRKL